MITLIQGGDIFQSQAQTLVCPVNVVGTMGNGLALAFKNRYPNLNMAYQQACRDKVFKKAGVFVFDPHPDRKVLCFPTKQHWGNPSRLEWIEEGLYILAHDYLHYGITSLALPALGCGKGQLQWEEVYPLIREYLDPLEIEVEVYTPN